MYRSSASHDLQILFTLEKVFSINPVDKGFQSYFCVNYSFIFIAVQSEEFTLEGARSSASQTMQVLIQLVRILARFEEIRDSHSVLRSKSDFLVHERLAFRLSTDELVINNAKQLALGIYVLGELDGERACSPVSDSQHLEQEIIQNYTA